MTMIKGEPTGDKKRVGSPLRPQYQTIYYFHCDQEGCDEVKTSYSHPPICQCQKNNGGRPRDPALHTPRECKLHSCNVKFKPTSREQKYCSKQCASIGISEGEGATWEGLSMADRPENYYKLNRTSAEVLEAHYPTAV